MALNGNKYGLGFLFTAKDLTGSTFRQVSSRLMGIKSVSEKSMSATRLAFGVAAGGAAALATGVGLVKGAIKAANLSGEFTQTLAAVGQITRASTEDLAALKEEVYATGLATKFTPAQIAGATKSLSELGMTANQSGESIRTVALLASAGMIDIDRAGRAVVGTLNAFHLSADQAANVGDKLARITQISAFQARDFHAGLSRAAVVASGYGQSLDDLLGTLGALRDSNLKANVASTGVREMMTQMYASAKVQKELKAIGVNVYDETTKQRRGMIDIMQELADATQNMTDKQKDNLLKPLLGKRGSQAFIAAGNAQKEVVQNGTKTILKGVDAIRYMVSETKKAAGTLEEQNEAVMNTFKGQKEIFEGVWATALTKLGEAFEKIFKPFIKLASFIVTNFANAWGSLGESVQMGVAAFTLASAAGLILTGVLTSMIAVAALGFAAFSAIGGPLIVVGVAAATLAGILGTVVMAMGALGLAAEDNRAGMGTFFRGILADAKLAFDGLKQYFEKGYIEGDTAKALGLDENKGVLRFVQRTIEALRRIKHFFYGLKDGINEVFGKNVGVFESFKETIVELGKALGITTTSMDHLSNTNADAKEGGKNWGQILGQIAIAAVKVTMWMIRAAIPIIKIAESWGPTILYIFGKIGEIVAKYPATFLLTSSLIIGLFRQTLAAKWAFKGILFVLRTTFGVFSKYLIPAALSLTKAAWGWASGMLAGLSPVIIMVAKLAAVFAVAYAVGTAFDRWLGISDKLAASLEKIKWVRDLSDKALSLIGMDYRVKGYDKLSAEERDGVGIGQGKMTAYTPKGGRFNGTDGQRAANGQQKGVNLRQPKVNAGNAGGAQQQELLGEMRKQTETNEKLLAEMKKTQRTTNLNLGDETVKRIVEKGGQISTQSAPSTSWSE